MLFAFVALVCLASVALARGRFGLLADVRFRGVWLAVGGLAVQVAVITVAPEGAEWTHTLPHLASYVLVGLVVYLNRHVAFLWVVGLGGLLNFTCIAANGGVMPASAWARNAAGLPAPDGEFTNSGVLADPHLLFLGDVFPLPAPWSPNVFSVGDLVMAAGAFLCLHALSQSAIGRRLAGRGASDGGAEEAGSGEASNVAPAQPGSTRQTRLGRVAFVVLGLLIVWLAPHRPLRRVRG